MDHGDVDDGNADNMIAWGESLLILTVSGTFEDILLFILPSLLLPLSEVTPSTTTSSFAGGFFPYGNISTPKYFFSLHRFASGLMRSSHSSSPISFLLHLAPPQICLIDQFVLFPTKENPPQEMLFLLHVSIFTRVRQSKLVSMHGVGWSIRLLNRFGCSNFF